MAHPFYLRENGLRFECTGCGECCRRPGPVYFSGGDLDRAARFLGLSGPAFRRRYGVYHLNGTPAVDPGAAACPFLGDDDRCSIYEARPTQCRTFPFWPETARRRRSWEAAARGCEGIGRGPVHPPEEIERAILDCAEAAVPEGDPW